MNLQITNIEIEKQNKISELEIELQKLRLTKNTKSAYVKWEKMFSAFREQSPTQDIFVCAIEFLTSLSSKYAFSSIQQASAAIKNYLPDVMDYNFSHMRRINHVMLTIKNLVRERKLQESKKNIDTTNRTVINKNGEEVVWKTKTQTKEISRRRFIAMFDELEKSGTKRDEQKRLIFQLCYFFALRRDELINLKREWISLEGEPGKEYVRLCIPGEFTKNKQEIVKNVPKSKQRYCLYTSIEKWILENRIIDGYLIRRITKRDEITEFGISRETLRKYFKSFGEDFSSHSARKSFICHASRNGCTAASIAGFTNHKINSLEPYLQEHNPKNNVAVASLLK